MHSMKKEWITVDDIVYTNFSLGRMKRFHSKNGDLFRSTADNAELSPEKLKEYRESINKKD